MFHGTFRCTVCLSRFYRRLLPELPSWLSVPSIVVVVRGRISAKRHQQNYRPIHLPKQNPTSGFNLSDAQFSDQLRFGILNGGHAFDGNMICIRFSKPQTRSLQCIQFTQSVCMHGTLCQWQLQYWL